VTVDKWGHSIGRLPGVIPRFSLADMSLEWRKSSYSVANSACVEVAISEGGDAVFVRDSKDPHGGTLCYDRDTWRRLIEDIRADRLRRP